MLSFFPRGVLDEILNLIESVSEDFPSYSFIDLCCKHGILTLNGRMFDDKGGEIFCVANDGSSVVVYMSASTSLFNSN